MSHPATADIAVLVGRFQPLHDAHSALLARALAIAPRVVVVVGSAFQARTPKNPFTWTERAEMIRQALPEAERARVAVVPMRDYYDEQRWVASVRQAVAGETGGDPTLRIALVGHFKDATSSYLAAFPGWTLDSVERLPGADGAQLRDALFGAMPEDAHEPPRWTRRWPPSSTRCRRRRSRSCAPGPRCPSSRELAVEWRMLKHYKDAWRAAPYAPTFVTVDAVLQCAGQRAADPPRQGAGPRAATRCRAASSRRARRRGSRACASSRRRRT